MPKLGMEEIRKKQVIEATLHQICEAGLSKLTLDKVAKRAGVSKGVVTYYFINKEEMILKSYDYMLDSYLQPGSDEEMMNATKEEIIEAIVKSVLGHGEYRNDPLPLSKNQMDVLFLEMFSKASSDSEFGKMMRKHYQAYFKSFMFLMGDPDSHQTKMHTIQFMALLDGLLLYRAIEFTADLPKDYDIVYDFLNRLF